MTFGQWLAQGGDYVIYLGAIVAAAVGICAAAVRIYKALTKPTRDAMEASEAGDRAIHERVDGLERCHVTYEAMFANDFASINLLKREATRQGESLVTLTEGVYLIIQHLVTNDHLQDMEAWMIRHAKQATSPDFGEANSIKSSNEKE